ncbi:unnamed protein product [Paramecium sonneborni]|uniref:RING-type domain-containing protein n=1 Tax=Paramecium sonneborni TaxID=65129 RepID=A0A8S1QXB9_9CILI|nr:unnamed protein product [Paramecium sonneborni]
MNQKYFEISPIPKHIKALSNFQKWINVGQGLDSALLVGLIEYHFKINNVEILKSKLFDFNPNNEAVVKIKNLLNIYQNKPSGFLQFLGQVKIQDSYGKYFQDVIIPYFRYNYKNNPEEKINFLSQTFQVQYQIIIEHSQKSSEKQFNYGNNPIILYKKEENYYLIQYQLIKQAPIEQICAQCKNQINPILLPCHHFLCFLCIKKEFQVSKLIQSFTCPYNQCQFLLNKTFYQNLQQQYENSICKQCDQTNSNNPNQPCKNCIESIKIQNQASQSIQKIENSKIQNNSEIIKNNIQQNQILQQQQQPQSSDSNLKQIIIQEENSQISEKKMENQQQKNNQSTQQTFNSNLQNEQEKQKIQIVEILQKCSKCKQQQMQNNIIQISCSHYYCISCAQQLCQYRNQFMCQECGNYVQTNVVLLAIQNNYQKQDQKCCICKQIFNMSFLFQNQCQDFICAPCLEVLAQKKQTYLRCPLCGKGIRERDADLFFDKILNLKLEQTKQQDEQFEQWQQKQYEIQRDQNNKYNQQIQIQTYKSENEQISKKDSKMIAIEQKNQHSNLIQLEEPQNCSFCFSLFTDYNTRQFLTYCQDSRHFIGVCCIIFPSDCPQCQLQSLNIEKGNLRFELQCIKTDDTLNINQYI